MRLQHTLVSDNYLLIASIVARDRERRGGVKLESGSLK